MRPLSPRPSVGLSVCWKVYYGEMADWIPMLFGAVGGRHSRTRTFFSWVRSSMPLTPLSSVTKRRNIHPLEPTHQSSFICYLHLLWSMTFSLFNLCVWQSFCTTSLQVFFGLPLGLTPCTSYNQSINQSINHLISEANCRNKNKSKTDNEIIIHLANGLEYATSSIGLRHTPYITSPHHCLFAAHAHTIATSFAVVPTLCLLMLVSQFWTNQ